MTLDDFLVSKLNLKDALMAWTDQDVACYWMAVSLGMFPASPNLDVFRENKWLFVTANPTGDALSEMLDMLCKIGYLEQNKSYQYRTKTPFTPSED